MAVADLERGDADMAVRYGPGEFPGLDACASSPTTSFRSAARGS
jgi:hypothetical protein